jgi:O-antigen/teichoic acid export membrane protein
MSNKKSAPSLSHQVSRAVIWNTVFVPLRMISEVAATTLKLTVLPMAAYGLLALVSGAASAFGTWIDMGTTRALPKFIPETMRARGAFGVLRLLLIVFLAQVIVLLGIAVTLAWQQQSYLDSLAARVREDTRIDQAAQTLLQSIIESQGWMFIAVIVVMLVMGVCYDMLMAYLNSFFKQRAWNGIALLAGLLPQLLAAIAIVAAQFSTEPLRWSVVGILVTAAMAPSFAVCIALWHVVSIWREGADTPINEPPRATSQWLPEGFLKYSGVSYLMTMTDFIASKGFAVYLTSSISDAALLWAGASLVGMVLSYLYTPLVGITVPLFTRVRSGEGGTIQGAYRSIVRIQLFLLVPGGIALMLLAAPALRILTPQYQDAVYIVYVLVPCLFIESLLTMAHNVLIVYEKLTIVTIGRLLTLVVIPLGFLFSPMYGVVGLALAYGLARVIAGIWATAWGWRIIHLEWPWRFTLRVLGASTIMACGIYGATLLMPPLEGTTGIWERLALLPGYGVIALVNALLFLVMLRVFGGLEVSDREQLLRINLPFKRYLMKVL